MNERSHPWSELWPTGVILEVAEPRDGEEPVLPEEEAFVARAVPERQRQFRAGRRCAHRALERLGLAPVALVPGVDRAPQWPRGVVGSVSHTGALCAVAAGHAGQFAGLGLDVEEQSPLPSAEWPIVCTDRELRALEEASDPGARAKTLFVIKECVYKCCLPSPGALLDFHSVEVTLTPGAFEAELLEDARPWLPRGTVLRGRHAYWRGHVLAALALAWG